MPTVRLNKSASRVVDILSLFTKSEVNLSIADIARELSLPKSSTFEIVYTLVEKGFLEIADNNRNTFKLGLKLFEVGAAFLSKADLHREARPQMEYLLAQIGRTIFLAVENKGEVVYLDKVEPYSAIHTGACLGSRNPMHCTGLGKAMLASYHEDRVRAITGGSKLKQKTPYSISEYNDLIEDLGKIRRRGYSIDDRESEIDVFCIAAPIYDRLGNPVSALSVASPAAVMNDTEIERVSKLVTASALTISRNLGFLGDKLYF